MYTFHVFLITIFSSLHMSLKKSLNLTCNVPKSLLFKVNSIGNSVNTKKSFLEILEFLILRGSKGGGEPLNFKKFAFFNITQL